MKKNYFAPEVIIVNIGSCCMLDASVNGESLQYKGNSENANTGLSRSSSFDDED